MGRLAVFLFGSLLCGCGNSSDTPNAQETLVVYSGRKEALVGPLVNTFSKKSGIDVQIRYGKTVELAGLILDEGENSPADVFFAQDAGALGALSERGVLGKLPSKLLLVDKRFRSPKNEWVGVSGRARVVAYNTNILKPEDLPGSIFGFTDPKWKDRIGWPPTNGSFQAFVTALRVTQGETKAREWLAAIKSNEPKEYPSNIAAVRAVSTGEVDVAFVNHYYLLRFLKEHGNEFPVRNHYLRGGDVGALVNVAGAGILATSRNSEAAERFVAYLLSEEAQQYFADKTFEYPLRQGIKVNAQLVPLAEIGHPDIDLSNLSDLEATLGLLRETGVLP